MKIISGGIGVFNEAGNYTLATVEYSGLVSCSIVKRSCTASKRMFLRIAKPTAWALSRPFVVVKGKTAKIFTRKVSSKKVLEDLESRLIKIEKRLAHLEKHGAPHLSEAAVFKKVKKLSEDKRLVLQEIFKETKSLKEME